MKKLTKHVIGKHGAVAMVGKDWDICCECGEPILETRKQKITYAIKRMFKEYKETFRRLAKE